MSEKDISKSLNEISKSLDEISNTLKPKPKKPNNIITIGWLFIGIISLYALYEVYKVFCR